MGWCGRSTPERRYFANNCVRHSAATAHVREVRHASVVTADAKQLALPKSRQCLFLDIRCSSARRENAGTLIRSAFCNEQSLFRSFSLRGRGHSPLIFCAFLVLHQNIAVQQLTLVIRGPRREISDFSVEYLFGVPVKRITSALRGHKLRITPSQFNVSGFSRRWTSVFQTKKRRNFAD